MNDRQRLEAIVGVVCRYLPPDGIPVSEAMSQIIALVDPLPESVPLTNEQPVELVRIEHWRQDTMESGHWEKTREMPRHIAERLLHHFDQASIITAAPTKGQP